MITFKLLVAVSKRDLKCIHMVLSKCYGSLKDFSVLPLSVSKNFLLKISNYFSTLQTLWMKAHQYYPPASCFQKASSANMWLLPYYQHSLQGFWWLMALRSSRKRTEELELSGPGFSHWPKELKDWLWRCPLNGKTANWPIESFFDERSLTATKNPAQSTKQSPDIQWGDVLM